MTKAKDREIERLTKLLEAETGRAEKMADAYRDTMYQLVDYKLRCERALIELQGGYHEDTAA